MNNIAKRTLSGVVYVGLMVGTLLIGYQWFWMLCVVLMILGIIEFSKMCGRKISNPISTVILIEDIIGCLSVMAGSILLSVAWDPNLYNGISDIVIFAIPIWVALFIIRCITELYTRSENPLKELAISVFMQLYIGIGIGAMCGLAIMPPIVLLLFVAIWSNDTGAYLVGCSIGKHRMFERVSPKKSWEGFFGGLVIACVIGSLFCMLPLMTQAAPDELPSLLIFIVVVVILGTWGDLIESLIKRGLHIKDSGNIIPGHGGILDRIDSLLLAAPAAVGLVYLYFCGHFVQ